jgi:hypothetical protein
MIAMHGYLVGPFTAVRRADPATLRYMIEAVALSEVKFVQKQVK